MILAKPFIVFLRGFFRDKISRTICCLSLFILVGCYFAFFQRQPLPFYPDKKNINVFYYNDKINKGNSIIIDTLGKDSDVCLRYVLKEGFVSPYVGIGFEHKLFRRYTISHFNKVQIQISGEVVKSILVYLVLKDEKTAIQGSKDGVLCSYLDIENKEKTFNLSIKNFKTPDWWFDKYDLTPAAVDKNNWKCIYRITIGPGLKPILNREQAIRIHSIIFYRDNTMVLVSMMLLQFTLMLSLLGWFYYKTRTKNQIKSVTINYQAINIEKKPKEDRSFLDYIGDHFHDSELSLSLISNQTGISQRHIAESILTQWNCNVKTYINQIRINEAKRLMSDTDLKISEIAYKVGFSSPSNFNRVFKRITNQTPSDYQLLKNAKKTMR